MNFWYIFVEFTTIFKHNKRFRITIHNAFSNKCLSHSIFSDSIGMAEESVIENKSGIRHFMSQKRRVGTSGGIPRSESVLTSSRSIRNNIMMNGLNTIYGKMPNVSMWKGYEFIIEYFDKGIMIYIYKIISWNKLFHFTILEKNNIKPNASIKARKTRT